jgi:hypothetical protein
MASIFYPSSASIYTRVVGTTGLSELHIDVLPNMVLVLTGSWPNTSSITFIEGFDTGSMYPISASWVLNSVTASYALTTKNDVDYIGNQAFS